MRVALSMSTMGINLIPVSVPTSKQDNASTSSANMKLNSSNSVVDAAFQLFLSQLFTTILQNNQQMSSVAGQTSDVDPEVQPISSNSAPTAQTPTPVKLAGMQDVNQSQSLPGAENKTDPKSPADKSAISHLSNQEVKPDPIEDMKQPVRETAKMTAPLLGQNNKPNDSAQDIQSIFKDINLKNSIDLPLQQGVALVGPTNNDVVETKKEQGDMASGKIDFTAVIQHEPLAIQMQTDHAAATHSSNTTVGPAPIRQQAVEPAELFDHTLSIVKDGSRLVVRLEPDGLGKLDINLSLEKGIVNAQIQVSDDTVRNLIENNVQQMVSALLKEGLSVGGFSVSLNQNGTWDRTTQYQQDSTEGNKGIFPQTARAIRPFRAQGLVNLFV